MHVPTVSIRRIALALALVAGSAQAQERTVRVRVTNLAAANGIAFAPTHVGFHRGLFDAFDIGTPAGDGIVSVAEGGAGGQWQADFAAADPTATRGTIGGVLLPGESRLMRFTVNTAVNRYFTFASMVVPSNDFFVGNDDPMRYRLFDGAGNLLIGSITQRAGQIWDAGSELFSIEGAAFLVDGINDVRTPQNGVVSFDFAELAGFDGQRTAAGYDFASGLTADREIYRIDFESSVVPEPSTYLLMVSGLLPLGLLGRRLRGGRGRG